MAVNDTLVDYILTLHNAQNPSTATAPSDPQHVTEALGARNMSLPNATSLATAVVSSSVDSITQIPSTTSFAYHSSSSPSLSTITAHSTADPTALSRDHNMAPLGLLAILILAIIGNITVCLVVKIERHLHHMTYYFFVSLAVVHLLMVALVMPPAVLIILAGKCCFSSKQRHLKEFTDHFHLRSIHLGFPAVRN